MMTVQWSGVSAAMLSTSNAYRNGCSPRPRQTSVALSADVPGSSKLLQLAPDHACQRCGGEMNGLEQVRTGDKVPNSRLIRVHLRTT